MSNCEYVRQYYGVNAEIGRDVMVGHRKGTITKDMGNYIGITMHDDKRKQSLPYHPTANVTYLESFTNIDRFKLSRSAQRYRDYIEADSSLTFKEWIGIY